MKEYSIKKVTTGDVQWNTIPKGTIDNYGWMDNGYTPKVEFAVCYDESGLYVKFWAYETEVRGEIKEHGGGVCEDSCVEFFFRPVSDARYLNIETNVLGKQLVGLGEERKGRVRIPVFDDTLKVQSSVQDAAEYKDDVWTVEYKVPFSFLKEQYGDIDFIAEGFMGNFYKCGDKTKFEHYGMWSKVEYFEPDYHRPEFFSKILFEK